MKKLLLGLILSIMTSSFAGGSASLDYILGLTTPKLASTLNAEFDLDEVGYCVRVGRHFPDGGERILPCEITGRHYQDHRVYVIKINGDGDDYTLSKLSDELDI